MTKIEKAKRRIRCPRCNYLLKISETNFAVQRFEPECPSCRRVMVRDKEL